jgi:hypothetical protein
VLFALVLWLETRQSALARRKPFTSAGISGLRNREVGTNRGRSLPLTLMSRRSRRLIGAATQPSLEGGPVQCRLREKDSKLTFTSGSPLVISILSTVPRHQRPFQSGQPTPKPVPLVSTFLRRPASLILRN